MSNSDEWLDAQAARLAAEQMATLGALVAGLSHELNTPLGALNSNHDVLRRALGRLQDILADERVDAEELAEVRRVVRALNGIMQVNDLAVERMTQLIANLRNFARPDRAERAHADLHEGIEGALAILGHQLKTITVERDFGSLPPVECYPNQLNQVWLNLLLNASQAINGAGIITIRTRAAAEQVTVAVADSGSGIARENLARIFEPGFTTKGGRIGMGLGLLIVKQIIDRHHGRITVNSEPGQGSTFEVTLPVNAPAR